MDSSSNSVLVESSNGVASSSAAASAQVEVSASCELQQPKKQQEEQPAKRDTVTVIDNRTGKSIEIPITHDSINAMEFRKFGLASYDAGFFNTAVCQSKITYIDGDKGILRYRGYNIEDLAEKSTFLEVAFLLINGELPSKPQLDTWTNKIMTHTCLHEDMSKQLASYRYDAHPMGIVISSIAALSLFYPGANPALQGADLYLGNTQLQNKQIYRILGKLPTIAACAYRNRIGRPFNQPVNHLSYTGNFLYMLDRLSEPDFVPHPLLCRALDVLFILHADHELNCSTAAMRHLSSSHVDPYSAVAGSAAALYGPLHGGACEAVLDMLEQIANVDAIPQFLEDVKNKKKKLMGFGHRIYKSYDPRATIVKKLAHEILEALGSEPLLDVAMELEKRALADDYFSSRKLYPNVDFYTGIIYRAMGFPTDMFPVLFAIPRCAGWLAHWVESLTEKDLKIFRPRQVYLGPEQRPYVSMDERPTPEVRDIESYVSAMSRRRSLRGNAAE